jgi:hypothetical protein
LSGWIACTVRAVRGMPEAISTLYVTTRTAGDTPLGRVFLRDPAAAHPCVRRVYVGNTRECCQPALT